MSWYEWRPYVSVAQKRRQAERTLAKLEKQGRATAPVHIAGRKIATSFWGQSWCTNLERYSDYASRLPRGRSYVRNGAIIDLQIARGEIAATVVGSEIYEIKVTIRSLAPERWKAICRDCAGSVDSLIELLQGRLANSVMERVSRGEDGLFPSPPEIALSCSCPDWADMCKHVAAALYGVGARLDEKPELLFVLRGVDEKELIAGAGQDLALATAPPDGAKVLDDGDVAALFGLELAEIARADTRAPTPPRSSRRSKPPGGASVPAATTRPSPTPERADRATRAKPTRKPPTGVGAPKRRASRRGPVSAS